jgi:hypothetical protein
MSVEDLAIYLEARAWLERKGDEALPLLRGAAIVARREGNQMPPTAGSRSSWPLRICCEKQA